MAERPTVPVPSATKHWEVHLTPNGAASMAAGCWPVLVRLVNRDAVAHGIDPRTPYELRLRAPALGLTLIAHDHPPPAGRLRVEPGGEIRLPFNLMERIVQPARLRPGRYLIALSFDSDLGAIEVPPTELILSP